MSIINVNSQTLQDSIAFKATYKLTYQKDSTSVESKKSEIMWLFIGDESSLFLSKPRALKDSLDLNSNVASVGSDTWKQSLAKTKTDIDFKIFKNRSNKEVYYSIKILEDRFFYSEPLETQNWIIQNESKKLLGYTAQKAITSFAGREYTAWFTSEIPISEGPYKFTGLPGLILEIKDARDHYNFELVGFEKLTPKLSLMVLPPDFRETSEQKLMNIQNKYQEDPVGYINNHVGKGGKKVSIKINGKSKQQYLKERKEKLASFNNSIEISQ